MRKDKRKTPTPSERSEGGASRARRLVSGGQVCAAELGVSGVLVNRPVLGRTLSACGCIKVSCCGMDGGHEEDGSGDGGGDESACHGVKQRECTAVEGHEHEPETFVAIHRGVYPMGCLSTKLGRRARERARGGWAVVNKNAVESERG
jgi:hypothetical protein